VSCRLSTHLSVCAASNSTSKKAKRLNAECSVPFSEMPLSPYMKEKLTSAKFSMPTPVQAAAIPQALAGKDVLATAMTGTGKTLAFLIPVIEQLLKQNTPGINALVLVPTRELAMQVVAQYNALRGKQLMPAALVVGGLSEGAQLQAIRKGARFVVATPGRLEDYLDRRLFHFNALRILILDEADRMLDMGFLPAIRRIVSILPKDRQTMCFSATMEGSMVRVVKDYMKEHGGFPSVLLSSLPKTFACRLLKWPWTAKWNCSSACLPKKPDVAWSSRAPSAEPSASPTI